MTGPRSVHHCLARGVAAIVCAFLATFLLAASLPAAEPGPSIVGVFFPLGNRFRNRTWSPVRAVLRQTDNKAEDLLFSLSLGLQGSGTNQAVFTRPVRLPARCEREITLFVYPDFDRKTIQDTFINADGTPALRESAVTFDDGSQVVQRGIYPRSMPRLESELFLNPGGTKLSQDTVPCGALHPDSLFAPLVEARTPTWMPGQVYRRDGLEYVVGEVEDDSLRLNIDDGVFYEKNAPTSEQLGGHFVSRGQVRVEDLPRTWAAYEGIDTLVLGSPRGHEGGLGLDPLQQAALLQWLRAGGRMVLLPNTDPAAWAHPYWEKLLPVRLAGRKRAHGAPLLEKRFGGRLAFSHDAPPPLEAALPAEAGEAELADEEYVALAHRRIGRGRTSFVALHGNALQGWRQNLDLWASLLQPAPDPVPGLSDELPPQAPGLMQRVIGVEAPDKAFVILLLLLYAGASAGALLYFRWRGRAERAWPIVLGLALLALGAAVWQARAVRQRTGFVQGEIGVSLLGPGSGLASARGYLGLYSPGSLSVSGVFENPSTLAAAYGTAQSSASVVSSLAVREEERFAIPDLRLAGGEVFLCRTMTLVRYGEGVALRLAFGPDGLSGAVENRSGRDLADCLLVANRSVFRIGLLRDGESRSLGECEQSATGALSTSDFAASEEAKSREEILGLLVRPSAPPSFLLEEAPNRRYNRPVSFYGWAAEPQARLLLGGESEPRSRALQLLCVPADRFGLPADRRIRVPAGFCGIELLDASASRVYGWDARPGAAARLSGPAPAAEQGDGDGASGPPRWLPCAGPAQFRVGFLRPAGLEGLAIERLRLRREIRLQGMEAEIRLFDFTRAAREKRDTGQDLWEPLPAANGGEAVEIDRTRFLGPGGELPRLQVRISPQAGATGGFDGGHWQVRSLELELEGRMPR